MSLWQIWRGAWPYVVLQLAALLVIAMFPALTTWLPAELLDLSIPKAPKFTE